MSYDFYYIIEKLEKEKFACEPFTHVEIKNVFSDEHFSELISSCDIYLSPQRSDKDLIKALETQGYASINFPGSVTDSDHYISWRKSKGTGRDKIINPNMNTACEGFGYVMRLYQVNSPIVAAVQSFFGSSEFHEAVAKKFNITANVIYDGGVQKYLDGYEISPHPDIRKKAATWMVNINPTVNSDLLNYHTHYMKFKKVRKYVQALWEANRDIERAWVPWDWAATCKVQDANNSMVLFAPSDNTLHAVRADYDHLITQRTQIYGNLWFHKSEASKGLKWEELDVLARAHDIFSRTDTGQGKRAI
ncbi:MULTISPECIES: hypothetical protein [unclassified Roseobacter]|uniref:hypothetical protein n=1 Tax=unclassified Roseobacter TaxID=196798 RepID=UPI0030EF6D01